MSLATILHFFHRQMQTNANLEQVISLAAKTIEEYDQQFLRQQVVVQEMQRSELELHTLECLQIQLEDDESEKLANLQNIRDMYSSFLELHYEIERLDLKNLFECKMQLAKVDIKEELQQMEEEHKRESKLNSMMENRGIVKLLRVQQEEFKLLQLDMEKANISANAKKADCVKKLRAAKEALNGYIVQFVIAAKELEQPHRNVQTLSTAKTLPQTKTLSDTNFNFRTPQTFYNFLAEYEKKKEIHLQENNDGVGLRSILNKPQNLESAPSESETLNTKRVTFLLHDISDESNVENRDQIDDFLNDSNQDKKDTSPTVNISFEGTSSSTPIRVNMDVDQNVGTFGEKDISNSTDQNQNANLLLNDDDKNVSNGNSQDANNLSVESVNKVEPDQNDGINDNRSKNIKILDQQIIKPAGTPLPKVLPIQLSQEKQPITFTTSDEDFKDSKSSMLDEFNTMVAGFMRNTKLSKSPTKEPCKNQSDTQLTAVNTFGDFFGGESAGFTNDEKMLAISSNENSFDLMDSDTAQNAAGGGRNGLDFL